MAKKTDTKTKRKPTQLEQRVRKLELYATANVDDWLMQHDNRIKELEKNHCTILSNIAAGFKSVIETDKVRDARIDAIEAKLLPPSPPAVVEEQWVPKVDEYVRYFVTDMVAGPSGIGRVVKECPPGPMTGRRSFEVQFPNTTGAFWIENLSPATSEEVLAYKERLERSKVNELQPNDGCLVDPDFLREMRMLELPSYSRPLDSDRECEYLEWDQGKLYRCRYLPGKPSPIPNTEFLRRARGTAARLKEEAKPLEFSRVRVTVRDRQYVLIDGPNELGYYAMYDMGNKAIYHAKRSEFTIKS